MVCYGISGVVSYTCSHYDEKWQKPITIQFQDGLDPASLCYRNCAEVTGEALAGIDYVLAQELSGIDSVLALELSGIESTLP